ncbi:uncharacterized protein LOC111086140 [Limulus polyphemus]|uniref:Uncharacterized protein LOC111086140 n=1 Tax=Limulus polyphemus TaxID=6850 RepID=A0ABM1SIQ9_LIMPO|nr:uncharacterized protein LOC111086140 [Limulus polyphemus]
MTVIFRKIKEPENGTEGPTQVFTPLHNSRSWRDTNVRLVWLAFFNPCRDLEPKQKGYLLAQSRQSFHYAHLALWSDAQGDFERVVVVRAIFTEKVPLYLSDSPYSSLASMCFRNHKARGECQEKDSYTTLKISEGRTAA